MRTTPPEELASLQALGETLVERLDFVDLVVLFALVKRSPELLAGALARAIASLAELEGLAAECRGGGEPSRR